MKRNKKEILLEAGCEIFLNKGYNGAGLNDILKQAMVPKGSFYHYFENKEAFLIEVMDFYIGNMKECISPYLYGNDAPALKRFQELMESLIESQLSTGCKGGCLIGSMAQELSDSSDNVHQAIRTNFESWVSIIQIFMEQAKEDGSINDSYDSHDLANMFADGWQGALLRMKVEKNVEPLTRFLNSFIKILGQR